MYEFAKANVKDDWEVIYIPLIMLFCANVLVIGTIYWCYFGSKDSLLPVEKLMEFHGKFKKLSEEPIITTSMSPRLQALEDKQGYVNINFPSVIKVPSWVKKPLGKYYCYFSHFKGDHIRLAYANKVEGPWKIAQDSVFDLADSGFPTD